MIIEGREGLDKKSSVTRISIFLSAFFISEILISPLSSKIVIKTCEMKRTEQHMLHEKALSFWSSEEKELAHMRPRK